ncbi:MAG: hypothetical protein AAGB93_14750 [Planctomycetota bacterium]
MHSIAPLLSALALGALASCSSTEASLDVEDPDVTATAGDPDTEPASTEDAEAEVEPEAPYEPTGDRFTMVLVRAVDGMRVPSGDELATLTSEHTAFLRALTEEGYLLAYGSIVPPRAEKDLRNMLLVDDEDPSAALARISENPAVEAGLFTCEPIPFITRTDLTVLGALERAEMMERGSSAGQRPYVMAIAETSRATTARIKKAGEPLLFFGHCSAGVLDGYSFALLDARTVDEARTHMDEPESTDEDTFTYHAWVASTSVDEID